MVSAITWRGRCTPLRSNHERGHMKTNRILLVATLVTLPAAIACNRQTESPTSTETAEGVSVKQSAIVVTGLGELSWSLPPYADPLRVPLIATNELKVNDRA